MDREEYCKKNSLFLLKVYRVWFWKEIVLSILVIMIIGRFEYKLER